jgi:hypothetical protein
MTRLSKFPKLGKSSLTIISSLALTPLVDVLTPNLSWQLNTKKGTDSKEQ